MYRYCGNSGEIYKVCGNRGYMQYASMATGGMDDPSCLITLTLKAISSNVRIIFTIGDNREQLLTHLNALSSKHVKHKHGI